MILKVEKVIIYCNVFIVKKDVVPTDEELLRLADAHFRKIDLSDGIYVVNMVTVQPQCH